MAVPPHCRRLVAPRDRAPERIIGTLLSLCLWSSWDRWATVPECKGMTATRSARMRDASGVRDWRSWHQAYDDPASSLARRLQVLRRRLDDSPPIRSVRRRRGCWLFMRATLGMFIAELACEPTAVRSMRSLLSSTRALRPGPPAQPTRRGWRVSSFVSAMPETPPSFLDVVPVHVLTLRRRTSRHRGRHRMEGSGDGPPRWLRHLDAR